MRSFESRIAALEAMNDPHIAPRMIVLYPGRIPDAEIVTLSRGDVAITRRAGEPWGDFTARAEAMSTRMATLWGAIPADGASGVAQRSPTMK